MFEQEQRVADPSLTPILDERALQLHCRCRTPHVRAGERPWLRRAPDDRATSHQLSSKSWSRIFQRLQESSAIGAVNQTMVVAEGEVAHRPHGDHVVDDDNALVDAADGEDGHLRLIDDRQSEQRAEDAGVGDGERPALHFLGLELLGSRAVGQILNRAGELEEIQLVGLLITGTMSPDSSATAMPRLMSCL